MDPLDEATQDYLDSLRVAVASRLGSDLVGIYLHGSAVLGGYDLRRSDVDVLVVSCGPLTTGRQRRLADALAPEFLPCPAKGLELSVVTIDSAATPRADPAFELHVTTTPEDRKVVDGHRPDGDPDLVLHYAVCRTAGRLLGVGPRPENVFAPVPDALVQAQLREELAWAAAEVPNEYAVLNACRAWRWNEEGHRMASKLDGGTWALSRLDAAERRLVARALVRQGSGNASSLNPEEVRQFVGRVRRLLES